MSADTPSDLVRFSRDGDQFHYLWAARKCLGLLHPTTDLIEISIEGASKRGTVNGEPIDAGEEIIDVAEYFCGEARSDPRKVCYSQLKHSTTAANLPWPPSGLKKTLSKFARRFVELRTKIGVPALDGTVQFAFVTNRPISADIIECLEDIVAGNANRHPVELEKLSEFTSLSGADLSSFCRLLTLSGEHEGFLDQRSSLQLETGTYIAGVDSDAAIRLKELVTRKATSEFAEDPSITRTDVLRALETTEDSLFPAPSLLADLPAAVPRIQESAILAKVMAADSPILIHASGGVGKSILAKRIVDQLQQGSGAVVFDCFANGEYRRPGSPRHRHKDGLVEIANELAGFGLCFPLIPSAHADRADYIRSFKARLQQCNAQLEAEGDTSLLCIIVDAADNAEMIAQELGESPSFAHDLLHETYPPRIRLIELCRTERRGLLDPPERVHQIELQPFELSETAALLTSHYPGVSVGEIEEFHRLTSRNPRVQITALSEGGSLNSVLQRLAPGPITVDDSMSQLLDRAISRLREKASQVERGQVEAIATGLAVLRPFVPISVLAKVAGVEESAVRSFAADLGRPLLLVADAIQFRDEPTETWFRNRYKPAKQALVGFVSTLRPLADHSTYVASSLPQLMMESGLLPELIQLALSSAALPADNPVDRRDVEVQRLQFALKASLQAGRFPDATNLALKASQEVAGNDRQDVLFQQNTDVVAACMDAARLQEIASRHPFSAKWPGARHAYEAALLAEIPTFRGEARSQYRMACDWVRTWARLPEDSRRDEQIEIADIAAMAATVWRIDGPAECARVLRGWRPRSLSFRIGRILARRALDLGLYMEIDALAGNSRSDFYLILAIASELCKVRRFLPEIAIKRMLRALRSRHAVIDASEHDYSDESTLAGITAVIEGAIQRRLANKADLAEILSSWLPDPPPYGITSHYGTTRRMLLRAFTLRAALMDQELAIETFANEDLRKELQQRRHSESQELRDLREEVGALLPWHKLRVWQLLTGPSLEQLRDQLSMTRVASAEVTKISYRERQFTSDEIAELWFEILVSSHIRSPDLVSEFNAWLNSLSSPIFIPTLEGLARLAGRSSGFEEDAYEFCRSAAAMIKGVREDAQAKADSYIALARAVMAFDPSEAREYFHLAIEVAGKVGDEVIARWQALLELADRASVPGCDNAQMSYRLARCGEVAESYNSKHFDWNGTLSTICRLSPTSCLTILSRWRDRRFGWFRRLLPQAVEDLVSAHYLGARAASALFWFVADWNYKEILSTVLGAAHPTECGAIMQRALRLIRLEEQGAELWKGLDALLSQYGIPDADLCPEIAYSLRITGRARDEHSSTETESQSQVQAQPESDRWKAVFGDRKIESIQHVWEAYDLFRVSPAPRSPEQFFRELVSRVAVGSEANIIRDLCEFPRFDAYDIREFLEQIPPEWKKRLAIQSALKEAAKRICIRFCHRMSRSRYYQPIPLRLLADVAGTPESQLISIVIGALSTTTASMGVDQLYSLTGLLAPLLTHDEAFSALDFGLCLLEETMTENDGDGCWRSTLHPPETVAKALAGLLYVSLGDPESHIRWQAAHVVRELCCAGESELVKEIVELAERGSAGPFVDPSLHFYDLHARQWLLIALARAARDVPRMVQDYRAFLVQQVSQEHVIMRHFASRALLAIADMNGGMVPQELVELCGRINRSVLPIRNSDRFKRYEESPPKMERWNVEGHFMFSFDMDRYWFEPLGRCFALVSSRVEEIAENIIRNDWSVSLDGGWRTDPRRQKGIFKDRETWHDHSSYPRVDDLGFYLSYHSMMVAAGRLLATRPLHQDPDEQENEFEHWVTGHLLTCPDGSWRADFRDPARLEIPSWWDARDSDTWKWEVVKSDFDRQLGLNDEIINVWGRWVRVDGRREEVIDIDSALISPERAAAFLRAAQTADPYDIAIPSTDGHGEIDHGPYQLNAWIDNATYEEKLDQFDLWAGNIAVPAPTPSAAVQELMQIRPEDQGRRWICYAEHDGRVELWSEIWGVQKAPDESTEGTSGRRLQASPGFICRLLERSRRSLIIKVQIERRLNRNRYEQTSEGDYVFTLPYYRYYIFDAAASCTAL